ncbi:sugar phosphate isomerase/epimerase family protein [Aquibacillus salsiterrae]|uniref:Sugar phosphate isomerase/epimerase n=1 Tax=Aquibacillus salsiterrae TaxID=2950439 RepID=A0A9X3WBZ2_9BACI|nr:sugar phosphate isomerase/epimerase [Aquibacillus salsiterrae]MDC3415993.1 sugar phosphate isomerase/epimerase [Aquibacillus salsiterrae]
MGKLGIQLYSVRDKTQDNFLDTIHELGKMGYDAVQFAGFFNTDAKTVRSVMDESGVIPAGSHTPFDQLKDDQLSGTLEYNETIGNRLVICPSLPKELQGSTDGFKRAAAALNEIGRKCKEQGFTFGYHNHHFEFADLGDGKHGFSILFEETDPAYVKMELDCYWALHAGYDPVKIIDEHTSRCVSLHLKDMKREDGNKVTTEIGEGELDLTTILERARNLSIPWLTVEQEDFDKDTLESARLNIVNLQKLWSRI